MSSKLFVELGVKLGDIAKPAQQLVNQIKQNVAPIKQIKLPDTSAIGKVASGAMVAAASAAAVLTGGLLAVGGASYYAGKRISEAFDSAGELVDISASTGLSVESLVVLKQAFDNVGLSTNEIPASINKMQKALTGINEQGEPTNQMFERLGLNFDDLGKLSPEQQFKTIGDAIGNLTNPAERATAAMSIFGKSGAKLNRIFTDGSAFETAAKQVGGTAKLLGDNANIFDKVSDNLKVSSNKLNGLFIGMASELAPQFDIILEKISKIDLSSFGAKIGYAISVGMEAFSNGEIYNIVETSLKLAFLSAINFGIAQMPSFASAFEGIGSALMGVFKAIKPLMEVAANSFALLLNDTLSGLLGFLEPMLKKVGLGDYIDGVKKKIENSSRQAQEALNSNKQTPEEQQQNGNKDTFDTSEVKEQLLADSAKSREAADKIKQQLLDKSNSVPPPNELPPNTELEKTTKPEKQARPQNFVLSPINGFGLFMKDSLAKDPLLSENQKQTALLEKQNNLLQKFIEKSSTQSNFLNPQLA